MNDITIIIPIHKYTEQTGKYLSSAIQSIEKNQENYTFGKLIPMIVGPSEIFEKIDGDLFDFVKCVNDGETDFCSQVNFGAGQATTDYFSILEVDDTYTDKWFSMAHEYFYTNESVSVFLPINILVSEKDNRFQYINEVAWAGSFSNQIGYLDFDCLQDYPSFNITGGIFNTQDFKEIGGLKPSIKVAFNYEFLLRVTNKQLSVFVVPKEGYRHLVGREDSLTDEYNKSLSDEEIAKWFDLAKAEYMHKEDRKTSVGKIKKETLK